MHQQRKKFIGLFLLASIGSMLVFLFLPGIGAATIPFSPWMLGFAFFLTIMVSCARYHYVTRVRV